MIPNLLLAAVLSSPVPPQETKLEFPQASPACTLKQRFGLTDVTVEYCRPSTKGRKVFGELVPYGQVWRTGANAATKITFSADVRIEGTPVPAGTYGLFTIPGEKEWTFILNEAPEQWGSYAYSEKKDLARIEMKLEKLAEPVETMTIDLAQLRDDTAQLTIAWEKTRIAVEIDNGIVEDLVPKIREAMQGEAKRKPYLPAAMFFYDHGVDLKQAVAWIDQASKEQPGAVWLVYRKGLVLAKAGDKPGALAAAQEALALAKKDGGELGAEYTRLAEALIASLK